jgi:hypothetical protein
MNISKDKMEELLRRFDQNDDINALTAALDLADSMDLEPRAPKADVLAFRTEKARLLLTVFNHIDAKLIPDFDFEDLPLMTTAPPPETGLPAGVNSKSIADPSMRARYEKEIAANQTKGRVYDFQSKLHKADQVCTEAFEDHVSRRYPKTAEAALDKLIDETVRSKAHRASLRERVADVFGHSR